MKETTQLSYGQGNISISVDTESQTEVTAPDIRFGDVNELVRACFTEKELEEILGGKNGEIDFDFTMSDELEDVLLIKEFDRAVSDAEKEKGRLGKGVYFDVDVSKSVGADDEKESITTFYNEVEMQIDIPLYLVEENRIYYTLVDSQGSFEIYDDADEFADSVAVDTHNIGTMLLLYQNKSDRKLDNVSQIVVKPQYIFIAGIVALLLIWRIADKMAHNKTE